MQKTIALLSLAAGLLANAHTQQQFLKRQCLPEEKYKADIEYNACYKDIDYFSLKTLNAIDIDLKNNSPQICADLCGRFGYKHAGLQNGLKCFCGNQIRNVKIAEDSCDMACPGDKGEICGGWGGNQTDYSKAEYSISIWDVENPRGSKKNPAYFPDCTREPLCSNGVCDTSLSVKERAAALISLWTVEEKIANLVEEAAGVPRLGLKPYDWWSEGLHGLATRGVDFNSPGTGVWDCATSFPQPILIGAAFDDDMVEAIGDVISTETRAFSAAGRVGLDLYMPNINSFKDPRWGRGQETPGEDPFHLQSYTRALLAGLERKVGGYKKVLTTCKHFAANDFESFGSVTRHDFDAQISLQDLNEFYLSPFRTCAERDGGSFMCSYNSVNGAPACANTYLMEDILRKHWGWESDEHYISTDCGAVTDVWRGHQYADSLGDAAAAVLKAGVDLECQSGNITALTEAWNSKAISEADMDKALTRMWAALVSVGWFDPGDKQELRKLSFRDVNTKKSQKLAYDAAVAGSVLIKNDNRHLPLKKKGQVAIIGPWTNATVQMQGNYVGPPPYLISPRQAAEDMGLDFTWAIGSGINAPDSSLEDAVKKAKAADQIIFMGGIDNSIEEEGRDRLNITWPEVQLQVLRKLSNLGKPITVVQFGAGQIDGTELLKNKAIKSILWTGYPGQSGGPAILDLIYGAAAPAGRLPVTQYPASYADEVPPTDMTLRPGQNGTNPGRTHMWYTGKAPVPFGHGLHYTDFKVSFDRKVSWIDEFAKAPGDTKQVKSLLSKTPWMELINRPALKLKLNVKNTGKTTSDYVALVFLRTDAGPKPYPKKTLVGYERVKGIKPGDKKTTEVTLRLERFLRVDEEGNQVLYPGNYELFVDIDEKSSHKVEWKGKSVVVEEFPKPTA